MKAESLNKILNLSEGKFYLIGTILFVLFAFMGNTNKSLNIISIILIFIATGCFCVGVIKFFLPYIKEIWKHWIGKIIITFLNILAYPISEIISNNLISLSLGLPPQDFEITRSILAILCYPFIVLFIIGVMLLILSAVLEILLMFVDVMINFINILSFNLAFKDKKSPLNMLNTGRIIGILFLSYIMFMLSFSPTILLQNLNFNQLLLNIAYHCDYQPIHKYPTINQDERAILHENGVISIAKIQSNEVIITIRKFED